MAPGPLQFWHLRSRWDCFAFIAVVMWVLLGAAAALGLSSAVYPPAAEYALLPLIAAVLVGYATPLVALATWRGSRSHDHLTPGWLYHLAALLFGHFVGVHYLWRTGRAD